MLRWLAENTATNISNLTDGDKLQIRYIVCGFGVRIESHDDCKLLYYAQCDAHIYFDIRSAKTIIETNKIRHCRCVYRVRVHVCAFGCHVFHAYKPLCIYTTTIVYMLCITLICNALILEGV